MQAGVTNAAYRSLCSSKFGAPLCVSEMVTAGTLLTNNKEALRIATFSDLEPVRSVQLYGVKPEQVRPRALNPTARRKRRSKTGCVAVLPP